MTKMFGGLLGIVVSAGLLAATSPASEKSTTGVQRTNATATKAIRTSWPPETIAGKIMMVYPAQNLLIVKGPDGVPFDMRVERSTRILSSGHRLTLKDLNLDKQKNVSVRFVPESTGDIARSIQLAG